MRNVIADVAESRRAAANSYGAGYDQGYLDVLEELLNDVARVMSSKFRGVDSRDEMTGFVGLVADKDRQIGRRIHPIRTVHKDLHKSGRDLQERHTGKRCATGRTTKIVFT
jgi:hypothetical protein